MFFLKPIRLFFKALTTDNTPKQMALGLALGIAIGLVPKGNLIAIVLMVILGALRVNLGVGILTAFCISWLGIWLDPLTHQLGSFLLQHHKLRPFWTEAYNLPVVPWTKFNNTVVLGSTCAGMMLLLPVYWLSTPLFAKYTPNWADRLQRYKIVQVLWGTEITGKLN